LGQTALPSDGVDLPVGDSYEQAMEPLVSGDNDYHGGVDAGHPYACASKSDSGLRGLTHLVGCAQRTATSPWSLSGLRGKGWRGFGPVSPLFIMLRNLNSVTKQGTQ